MEWERDAEEVKDTFALDALVILRKCLDREYTLDNEPIDLADFLQPMDFSGDDAELTGNLNAIPNLTVGQEIAFGGVDCILRRIK